jgi:hypothetical protein
MGFVDLLIARWRTLRCGDLAAVLLLAAIMGIVAIAVVKFPNFSRTGNFGFGPDWECSYPGKGEPVCVKKPAPSR